jgi:hypothetical protein
MADFARLACAAAPAFGWNDEAVLAAMTVNRAASVETVMGSDPIAGAVEEIQTDYPDGWDGTASQLLGAINLRVAPEVKNERGWPKDAARLSTRLKRAAPALRRVGVDVVLPTGGGRSGRVIVIRPTDKGNQRSERSERSDDSQAADITAKHWNALERSTGFGNADDSGHRNGESSRNADSVPERSANSLNNNWWNTGNAGNADSP